MLTDLRTVETLHLGTDTQVLRALTPENLSVIVKTHRDPAPSRELTARLLHEAKLLQLMQKFASAHIPKLLDLRQEGGRVGLILEDIGGLSLPAHKLLAHPMPLTTALEIATQVAQALDTIHQARLFHKDVNPNNIVWNPALGRAQLIDFGIASQLKREIQRNESLLGLEGTPAYLAPEQTGRTVRSVDHRADFYGLGATLYHLSTGHLPFERDNLNDLIYAVLTQMPPSPASVRADLPEAVVQIIMHLMAKSPDDRYQSAHGILADLQQCLDDAKNQRTPAFRLKQHDRIERFEVPNKLYGRDAEVQAVEAAFLRSQASTRPQLLMICGPSGIGKSTLLQTVQPQLIARQGWFATGKHDQIRNGTPFAALAQAITSLVHQILKQPEAQREQWIRRIRGAVGNIGAAVVDIAPALKLLIGPQKPLSRLDPRETENRLVVLLQKFLGALSAQPLVLFLDDLQWADTATIKLLGRLAMEGESPAGLLIIGAYRDREVDAAHPLQVLFAELQRAHIRMDTLQVAPLSEAHIAALIADMTHGNAVDIQQLASRLAQQTDGNPFFLRVMLEHLWDQQLITFAAHSGKFAWDLEAIGKTSLPDDIADFMTDKLRALPARDAVTLSQAALLGNVFQLSMLIEVSGLARSAVIGHLHSSLQNGLIIAVSEGSRYVEDSGADATYTFGHDRIQQAAYDLITPQERQALHWRAGQVLWQRYRSAPADTPIFVLLRHLNACTALVTDAAQVAELVDLNRSAGESAMRSVSYQIAHEHFDRALSLSGDLALLRPDVFRAVNLSLAECEFLSGAAPAALARLAELARRSAPGYPLAELRCLQATILADTGETAASIKVASQALEALGFSRWYMHPASLPAAVAEFLQQVRRAEWPALENAPPCTDATVMLAMRILSAAAGSAYLISQMTFVVVAMRLYLLAVKHGNSVYSANSYVGISALLVSLEYFELGAGYARLAEKITQQHGSKNPGALMVTKALYVDYLAKPPKNQLEGLEQGIVLSLEQGDLEYAGWLVLSLGYISFSVSLEQMLSLLQRYESVIARRPTQHVILTAYRQVAEYLRGTTDKLPLAELLTGKREAEATRAWTAYSLHLLLMVNCVTGDTAKACAAIAQLKSLSVFQQLVGVQSAQFCVYAPLALLRQATEAQRRFVAQGRLYGTCTRRLRKMAHTSPSTFAAMLILVQAEHAAMKGQGMTAATLYEKALTTGTNAVDFTALILHCAGRFYARQNLASFSAHFFRKTAAAYEAWGVASAVHGLGTAAARESHASPQLRTVAGQTTVVNTVNVLTQTRSTSTNTNTSDTLDLPAFIAVAQAISGEVVFDKLMAQIVGGMRQIAAASRVVLLRVDGEQWTVAVDTATQTEVPREVLNFVRRSQQTFILRDFSRSEIADPYLATTHAKALVCTPIMHRSVVTGLIYLENDTTADAFVDARLPLIEVLAAQAGIAIENARIYQDMESVVARRTEELRQTHARLLNVERESAELDMAGGFAHEMRNALVSSVWPLAMLFPTSQKSTTAIWPTLIGQFDHLQKITAPDAAQDMETLRQSIGDIRDMIDSAVPMLERVVEGLQRATSITNEILSYAQTSQIVAGADTVRLHDVIAKIVKEQGPRWKAEGIAISLDVDPDTRVIIREEHAYAIVRNLLTNARDALILQTSQARAIELHTTQTTDVMKLQVKDNGIGMSVDTQANVFRPFFTTKGAEGTGLGLGLSRRLARVYGGDLTFQSAPNQGTTFEWSLPTARSER